MVKEEFLIRFIIIIIIIIIILHYFSLYFFFSFVLSFIFSSKFRVQVWSCREIYEHNFLGSLDLVFNAPKQSSIVGILRDLLNQTFCIKY
jgi:hypothetical protein